MTDTAERAAQRAKKKLLEIADARAPEFSDEGLAERFAKSHSDGMCYVSVWSQWYTWTGTRWHQDSTLLAFDRARAICRIASAEANKPPIKERLASAKTVSAVERLAKADRRIAATVEQWDENPDILNIEKGERDDDR